VKTFRQYQNESGRIIDPVKKQEMYYSTPCYAHSVAVLAASGFTNDAELIESGMKALDIVTEDMANNQSAGQHGDFYTYPVMLAFSLYKGIADETRYMKWKNNLAAMNPAKFYSQYGNGGNNWKIVNIAGEFLRSKENLTSIDYVEKYLPEQLQKFTENGMYVDDVHSSPPAYDLFPRHYLDGMLTLGYCGKYFETYQTILEKAAWMSLFLQSPFGEIPTGYRSSHHIWNEAEQCVVFEIYAKRYAAQGETEKAEAFKRGAMLSLQSMKSWIRPDGSGYIVKNKYPIESQHGYENYSVHACYNMLAASMLAQSYQFAEWDDKNGIDYKTVLCLSLSYLLKAFQKNDLLLLMTKISKQFARCCRSPIYDADAHLTVARQKGKRKFV
jgi:hypothetical protein